MKQIKIKRVIDILLSLILIIMLLPLFFLVSALIFFYVGRPILFIQDRPGKDSKIFKLIKFRTMINDDSKEDEDRLTSLGSFLRSYSLDELPELYNILIGDMSFVGPRPLLKDYLPLYNEMQQKRHDIRPGLTGWAQINGRNTLDWEDRFNLDLWYVENQSLLLDLKIILLTVKKVFLREGISAVGEATMKKFSGTSEK